MNNSLSSNRFEQLQQQIPFEQQGEMDNRMSLMKKCVALSKQKYQRIKNTLYRQSRKIYALVVGILMLYLFYISYEFENGLKCPFTTESQCIEKFLNPKRNQIGMWATRISINSIILIFFIHLLILNKTIRFLLFSGIIQIYWLYIHGQYKMNPTNMGGMFKICHIILMLITTVVYGLYMICRLFSKNNKKVIFGSFVVGIGLLYFIFIQNSCYFWKFGINGEIHQSSSLCKVKQPSCWLMYMGNLIDMSPFLYQPSLGKPFQQIIDKYIPNSQKGNIIAFANSNSFTQPQRTTQNLQQSVFNNSNRYKTLDEALNSDKKYDVVLDNQRQIYHIKINRNESLVLQRKELFKKAMDSSSPPIVKNVLFLFFDSISRAQAHLKLPKTLKWFEKRSNYASYLDPQPQKFDPNSSQAYEFYRYNSVGYLTGENCFAMYYGLPYTLKEGMLKSQYISTTERLREVDKKQKEHPQDVVFFGKNYQDKGFITSSSGTYCNVMNADRYQYEVKSFSSPRFDHQTHSFACDPNFQSLENKFSIFSGASSATDRNLYGKKMSEYAFQYALSFFDAYKDVPKLQVLNFMEGHDYYVGSTKQVDKPFRDFFDEFQSRGYTKDTVIILASDHGQHFIDLFGKYLTQHFHGLLVVDLPKDINIKYREAIRKNQQNLVTAWNIYYTLQHLLHGDDYKQRYMSLLSNINFQKTCKDAKIPQDPPQTCACVL